MASLKRNNVVAYDYPMSKFLYFILKQMDLKTIDWNQVAEDCEITNGHAARMRFSRFRAQMEGTAPAPRRGRPPNNPDKTDAGVKKPKGRVGAKAAQIKPKTSYEMTKADYKIKPERGNVIKDDYETAPKMEPDRYRIVKHEHESMAEPSIKPEYYDYDAPWTNYNMETFNGSRAAMNDMFDQEMAPWFMLHDFAGDEDDEEDDEDFEDDGSMSYYKG